MTQVEARRLALKLHGVAIEAMPLKGGGWQIGGWPNRPGMEWIVIDPFNGTVIATTP